MADPKIKYDIEANVKGDAEVGQLAGKLEALAKTLDGDLKTNANAAAAALRQLGDKQTAIARFVELKQGAQDAAAKLNDAQAAAQKMGQTLAATETPTRAQAGQMQKLGDAVRAAKAEIIEQTTALEQARGTLQQYGVQTTGLSQTQVGLARTLDDTVKTATAYKASIDEIRESDRLLAIEAKTLAAEMEKGRIALLAENAAQLDVAAQIRKTTQAKAAAALAAKEAEDAWQKEAFSLVEAAEAAQKLKRETDALADSQRLMVTSADFEKVEQESKKLLQAANYVEFWAKELKAAETAEKATADAAKEAADKISNAFKTVGVRSAEELRSEIVQVRAAMDTVKASAAVTGNAVAGAFAAGNARIKELERDIRDVSGTLTMADKAAGLFKTSMGRITAGNIVADGVGYVANKLKELGAAFLGAMVDGDQMRRGLMAIYKDASVTASQIDFLRKSSSESGVAFGQLGSEFVKFSASMQSANIPLEQSNNLFKAVTAASATLGLGTEATAGALNALGQMASKGTVSMEELRQQLGDRLPGALGLAATGLGITEAQLIKLVSSGSLATRDFIVPFTEALGTMHGEIDGLVPAYDRLKGLMTESAQGVGDAGGVVLLTGALKVLGGFVGAVVLGLSTLVETVFLVGSGVSALAARLMGDSKAWEFFSAQVEKSTNRLTNQANSFNAFLDPAAAAAAATTKHADALTRHTAEVVKSINANASLGSEQKLAALATALAADATLDASAKIVQYNVAAAELIAKQEGQTAAYTKSAKAAKEQGDTLVSLAKLTGDATASQSASTQAAALYSAALDKVAASQAAETAMLVAQKAELLASAENRKLSAQDIKVETEALDKKITTSQAETEQARQSALAQKAELFERQLAVSVLKDHSAEVGNFKKAMQDAAATLENYERLALNGKKTDAEVAEARKALTTATVLYKDALTDLISKTELEAKAKSTSLQLAAAQAKAGADHSLAMAAEARALGDTATAIYYEIKAREQNIAVMKLEIQIRELEAKAALATIDLKQKSLDLMTEEGRKKFEILEIEKKIIEIKLLANGATKDAIAAMEREITALRDGVDLRGKSASTIDRETGARQASTSVIDRQTTALETQNAATERSNAATQKAIDLENKRLNRDKEGFSLNTAGQRVNVAVPTKSSIYEQAKSAGLTDAQAAKLSKDTALPYNGPGMKVANGFDDGSNWSTELQKAIDKQVLKNAGTTASAAGTTASAASASSSAAEEEARLAAQSKATAVNSYTTNVTIESRTRQINTTDAASSAALQEVLRELSAARSTSSR